MIKPYLKFLVYAYLVLFAASCTTNKKPDLSADIKAVENGLVPAILIDGDSLSFYSILERMKFHKVPGVSIAIVNDGKLHWAKGYGVANSITGTDVDRNTLFQAGSISKPVAALAAMKLVEEGRVSLDTAINKYLETWKIQESRFSQNEKVTLRRLLTHTAGMTVHGFPGYPTNETMPSLIDVLNGKGNTDPIVVDTFPGTLWRYSGGGYTVMQLLVEEITGETFEAYLQNEILAPLGMESSTYEQPLPESMHARASAAYDTEGQIIEGDWHNYPEKAAAGLWTTPTDLANYCIEMHKIFTGQKNGILKKATVDSMFRKHRNDWGLGPVMRWEGDSLRFEHGGKNAGFTNTMIAFAKRGDAVIVMTNGDNGGKLINEILRSVSGYYGWGIRSPRYISPIEMSKEQLTPLTGNYKYDEAIPAIGEYWVEIKLNGSTLVAVDTIENVTYNLIPLGEGKFIDINLGDEVTFNYDDNTVTSLIWNDRFNFIKID
jgi:CubicO group peptidase (beta-lactamase class C family)